MSWQLSGIRRLLVYQEKQEACTVDTTIQVLFLYKHKRSLWPCTEHIDMDWTYKVEMVQEVNKALPAYWTLSLCLQSCQHENHWIISRCCFYVLSVFVAIHSDHRLLVAPVHQLLYLITQNSLQQEVKDLWHTRDISDLLKLPAPGNAREGNGSLMRTLFMGGNQDWSAHWSPPQSPPCPVALIG